MKKAMITMGILAATAVGALADTGDPLTEIGTALSDGKVQALGVIAAAGAVFLSLRTFGGVWRVAGAWIRAAIGGAK